mmetsp:Transcript_23302/g.34399  ORF Transcript_23302/g.34399 Transcript_23302/m.34399 type:complete len:155 (-) Transcript_23302:293-757(-)
MLLWTDAQLLLMTQHHGQVPPLLSSLWMIRLSPALSQGCPANFMLCMQLSKRASYPGFIELIIALHPKQLLKKDICGRLPLHWSSILATTNYKIYCLPCRKMKYARGWYGDKRHNLNVCECCYKNGLRFAIAHGMDDQTRIQFNPDPDPPLLDM